MSVLLTSVALLLLFAAAVTALPVLHAAWVRLMARGGELQIWRVMSRVDVSPEELPAPELARAVRRCVLCPSIEQCDPWLAADKREGLDEFCPNASLLARLAKDRPQRG